MMGSVSGGCVEGAVVAEALDALEDGEPRILTYGVADEDAFAVGLACGGTIRVLVEPLGVGKGPDLPLVEALVDARAARRPAAYVVEPATWSHVLLNASSRSPLGDPVRARLVSDRSGFDTVGETEWFIGVHNPALRMIIIGAVHIAQVLAPMARMAGYDVTVVDPRTAFASRERFAGTTLLHEWPDAALETLTLDRRTAVVTLTHDPKLDDPALKTALASEAFYIGALGSTRTHAKRVARLAEAGFGDSDIERLHAPVGLDIGAKSPAEIAVSVLAQITERLRQP
jgi:xanthine dehydrogenase accessory factor